MMLSTSLPQFVPLGEAIPADSHDVTETGLSRKRITDLYSDNTLLFANHEIDECARCI